MIGIGVLGPLQVTVGGDEVVVPGRRERAVLATLAVHAPRAVSTTTLYDHLWGDDPPRTAHKAVQTAVSNLRRLVADAAPADDAEEGWLSTTDGGYRLDPAIVEVDAHRFDDLVSEGRGHARTGAADEAAAAFARALSLWRGVEVAALGDGPLAVAAAHQLAERRLEALADCFDADLAAGRSADVVADLSRCCDERPLDERFHAQLATALYQQGRQADALAVITRHREALLDGHGLDTGPGLAELERRILDHDPALSAAPTPAVASAQKGSRASDGSERPPAGPALVGRDADLEGVESALRSARVVTLVGPGGVGKTTLAHAATVRWATDGREGLWCSLGDVAQPEQVVPALATALDVPQQAGTTMTSALVRRLADDDGLLVLDNCEHVLAEVADVVGRLISGCPGVTVLATSRERLGIGEEQVWPLVGLAVDVESGSGDGVAPAVRLFLERASQADPHFHVDEDVMGDVVRVCRALDGLPLAIELAAARVRSLPPAEIARRLDSRLDLLAGGRRDVVARHRSLRELVEWSHDLLGDRQRRLLRRLGAFAGPFSMDAAEQVGAAGGELRSADVTSLLPDLVDKSLVAVDPGPGPARYRLLETIRVFAHEQMAAAGEVAAVEEAFVAHWRGRLETLQREVSGSGEVEAAAFVARSFDNVRHAVSTARRRGDVAAEASMLAGLTRYLWHRMSWEASQWMVDALDRVGEPGGSDTLRRKVAAAAAWGSWRAGDLDAAQTIVERFLPAERHDDEPVEGTMELLAARSVVEMYRNEPGATATMDVVADMAETSDDLWMWAYVLGGAALVAAYAGDRESAARHVERQGALALRTRSRTAEAWWHYCTAEVSGDHDPVATVTHARRAIDLARSVGSDLIENVARITAVTVASRHGAGPEVADEMRVVIERCRQQGAWTHVYVTVHNLIEALADHGGADDVAVSLLHAEPESPAVAYGEQRRRLDQVAGMLRGRMTSSAFERAANTGRALGRDDVVRLALEGVGALQRTDPVSP